MRAFYESMYRNFSANGSNFSSWWNSSNFSNFTGWNDTDYMRSYYEHAARNFSAGDDNTSEHGGANEKSEL